MLSALKKDLRSLGNPEKARFLARFFKTGPGEYGEGDVFLGITVPETRMVARKYRGLRMLEVRRLLQSRFHEERLVALLILVEKYEKADAKGKEAIFDFYITNLKRINNWDLVDLSAAKIVGNFLLDKGRRALYGLALSKNLWERRVAIVSTYEFIRNMQFEDTFKVSRLLLEDKHDLIHKAVGWMLREVGKRNVAAEEEFLKKHNTKMPRTMLRYAIERFDEEKRKRFLKKRV